MGRNRGFVHAAMALLHLLYAANAARTTLVAQPDYSMYHTRVQVFQKLDELVTRFPHHLQMENLTHEHEGYASTLTVINVNTARHIPAEHKLRLLLNFGQHGRELITVELALRLLELLAEPLRLKELPFFADKPLQPLLDLLALCDIRVVPMENTAGRVLVEGGALCERKNGRGVDPNRNWELHWGHKEKDYDPNEEHPGKHPFSEPEAFLIKRVAESLHPHVWLNVHSGMEALFMPYDHQAQIPQGAEAEATLHMLEALNTMACRNQCAVGSGGKSVGYLAHGTATDYMYETLKVPLAFTWEIYGDAAAPYEDCFRMFNPVTRQGVQQVLDQWTSTIFMLLELLPAHPSIPPLYHTTAHTDGGSTGGNSAAATTTTTTTTGGGGDGGVSGDTTHAVHTHDGGGAGGGDATPVPYIGTQHIETQHIEDTQLLGGVMMLPGQGQGGGGHRSVEIHRHRQALAALQSFEVAMLLIAVSFFILLGGCYYVFCMGGTLLGVGGTARKAPKSPPLGKSNGGGGGVGCGVGGGGAHMEGYHTSANSRVHAA